MADRKLGTALGATIGDAQKLAPNVPSLFVGEYMFENARAGKLTSGKKVYIGGVGRALQSMFSNGKVAEVEALRKLVTPWLRANGFNNIPLPRENNTGAGGGWVVPDTMPVNWAEPSAPATASQSAATKRHAEAQAEKGKTLAGPVKHKWKCHYCDATYPTQSQRGQHEDGHSRKAGDTTVTGGQTLLLEQVVKKPHEHPRYYAKQMKVGGGSLSPAARKLEADGLLTRSGSTQGTRWSPTAKGIKMVADARAATYRKGTPKDEPTYHRHPRSNGTSTAVDADAVVAAAVPATVERLTNEQLNEAEGDLLAMELRGMEYISREAAEVLITKAEQLAQVAASYREQAKSAEAEVESLVTALEALQK